MEFFRRFRKGSEAREREGYGVALYEGNERGERVFRNPSYVKYTEPNRQITLLFPYRSRPLPQDGEVVEVRLFGGSLEMAVELSEENVGEDGMPTLTLHGRRVNVGWSAG